MILNVNFICLSSFLKTTANFHYPTLSCNLQLLNQSSQDIIYIRDAQNIKILTNTNMLINILM